MIRLSIQARQALARLLLPVLIVASLGLMLLGRASPGVAEHARTALSDTLAPIDGVLAVPLHAVRDTAEAVREVFTLRDENLSLRAENARLRRWYDVAMALDAGGGVDWPLPVLINGGGRRCSRRCGAARQCTCSVQAFEARAPTRVT